jgi:hypothetical protein
MTKAADTEHRDKVARLRWRVSQGVERREPRAQQRPASADDRSSGIRTSPVALAIITSAYPPSE